MLCGLGYAKISIYLDSYDVVFTMGAEDMLQKFRDFDCRLVFSAESFCWPDMSLAVTTPTAPGCMPSPMLYFSSSTGQVPSSGPRQEVPLLGR